MENNLQIILQKVPRNESAKAYLGVARDVSLIYHLQKYDGGAFLDGLPFQTWHRKENVKDRRGVLCFNQMDT